MKLKPVLIGLFVIGFVSLSAQWAQADMSGTYNLNSHDCTVITFPATVTISQSGTDLTVTSPAGYTGTDQGSGDFEISNGTTTCAGNHNEGTGVSTTTCIDPNETCSAEYQKQ